jgi:hypothetical protein
MKPGEFLIVIVDVELIFVAFSVQVSGPSLIKVYH